MDMTGESMNSMPRQPAMGSSSSSNQAITTSVSNGAMRSRPSRPRQRAMGSSSSNQAIMTSVSNGAMRSRPRKSKSSARRVSNINTYQAGVEEGVNISQQIQDALPGIGSSSNGLFGGSRKRKNKRKQKKTRKHKSRKH